MKIDKHKLLNYVFIFAISMFLATAVYGATRAIVPRADTEGSIGTAAKKWGHVYTVDLTATNAMTGSVTGNAGTVTGFTPASGSLTLAGADALTITTTGATNSTLPLGTKTLVATDVATLSSLTSVGTLTTGDANAIIERTLGIAIVGTDTAVAIATSTSSNTASVSLNGMNVTNAICSVEDKGVTGTTEVALVRRRAGADVYVFSTNITLGDEFFATDETINTSNDDIATGDTFTWEIKGIHSGTAPNGLDCNFIASN